MPKADTGTRGTDGTMDRAKVLSLVQKLINQASDTRLDPAEARRFQERADALMMTYNIQEIRAEAGMSISDRAKPGKRKVFMSAEGSRELLGWVASLANIVARHCRCKVRLYAGYDREEHAYYANVYGFEMDLMYFDMLYTNLRLHMLGVLLARVSPDESVDENCWRLHNAGYNWLEIAGLYGWRKRGIFLEGPQHGKERWVHKDTGEEKTNWQLGSYYKRCYHRARIEHGGQNVIIPAGGSATFRESAAQGYAQRIERRLRDIESKREVGAEVAIRVRWEDIMELYRQDNADLFAPREPREPCPKCAKAKSGHCRDHPAGTWKEAPFSHAGYAAGVAHANTADLNGNRTESRSTKELA
jgi:hypothetical protein